MFDLHRLVALSRLGQLRNRLIDVHLHDMNRSEILVLFEAVYVALSLPLSSHW